MKTVRKRKRDSDEKVTVRSVVKPLLFIAPFMLGILVFTLYPFINAVLISFKEDYRVLTGAYSGYGIANYTKILSDPTFIGAIRNTTQYVLIVVPVAMVLSIIIAVMLNSASRLQGLFQTAYFMPLVTSTAAVGLVFRWLFNYDYGLFNFLLSLLGIDPINWLNNPTYSMISLAIYGIWSMMPFTIILLLAGLQNIDKQYYTAAKVDGARTLDLFFNITLPLLAPTIGLVAIVNTMSAFKVFDSLYVLFGGKPGPAYNLYTVIYYLYEQFYTKMRLGPAAASAMVLFFIILVFTLIQNWIQKKWSYR
ncbi:MAG: sugar ABC transporter permease [Erysipelotrichaceae bacterium]|nr:sugar ABC transporter permease [Erysipelotrichaceae bacterium]MBO4537260.1 sugar ABC transporter permease [Erysipelotrichaceae bacterium]MBR5048662.1 sugar ABC transporter permease [Erysipelotrichaceae bacterium]